MASSGAGIAIVIVGIILRIVIRLALKSRNENTYVTSGATELDPATRRLLATPDFDAKAETRAICIGTQQATVMLFDVEGELTIDGVEIALPDLAKKLDGPAAGGYRDATRDAVGRAVAIVRICPGHHSIQARVGTQRVTTSLFLHANETWARRVPAGDTTWDDVGAGDVERARRGMKEGTTTAIAYAEHVLPGIPAVVSVDVRVKRALGLYTRAANLFATPPSAALAPEIERLRVDMSAELLGAGLSAARVESLVGGFGAIIWETRAKGALEKAVLQTELALTVIPDEPRFLALLGETEKALGRGEQARAHLERALARGKLLGVSSLDASWIERVQNALA